MRSPVFWLALVAGLSAFVVQSGELGTSDTAHRLQTTDSFWTSEPAVLPDDYPEFGIPGRNGKLYSWYGIGQSLLMWPADVVGTYVERLPIFADYGDTDPTVRDIIVSYSTNILIGVLTALVCFRFLRLLGFSPREAVAGVLALLFCTTHLHYTQNMTENNYILLLTLAGLTYQYEWLITGSRRALLAGSAAFGLNLLTRLTTALDLLAGGIFLLLVLWFENMRGRELWARAVTWAKTAAPVYVLFVALDRLYQYYRFGSFFNTYLSLYAIQRRRLHPSLPANFPWELPFRMGFFGALFKPEKSIFLFDPLLLLTILVAVIAWKSMRPEAKAYLTTGFGLLLTYICFYARFSFWSGDYAWGDRYVSSAAELVAFISVPLLLRYRKELAKPVRLVGAFLIAASAAIQLASLAFWLTLEVSQVHAANHPIFVVGLRFKNIVAFALGKVDQWGLTSPTITTDPWAYVHVTTWNFLPFLLRRVGEAPGWAVDVTFAVWIVALVATAWSLWRLRQALKADVPEGS